MDGFRRRLLGIRKQQCSFGWDWGPRFPTSGIYRPSSFTAGPHNRLESLRVVQEHRSGSAQFLRSSDNLPSRRPPHLQEASPASSVEDAVERSRPVLLDHAQGFQAVVGPA